MKLVTPFAPPPVGSSAHLDHTVQLPAASLQASASTPKIEISLKKWSDCLDVLEFEFPNVSNLFLHCLSTTEINVEIRTHFHQIFLKWGNFLECGNTVASLPGVIIYAGDRCTHQARSPYRTSHQGVQIHAKMTVSVLVPVTIVPPIDFDKS